MTGRSLRSIVVISLRYFGDVLLTTPLIRSLRAGYPQAKIDVLLSAGAEGILEGNPDVSDVVTIGRRPSLADQSALVRRLLGRRYDLAVVAETGDRPHFYGCFAAPERVGLVPAEGTKSWWKRPLLRHSVVTTATQSRIENYDCLARAMGIPFVAEVVAPTAHIPRETWMRRLGFDAARERYAVLQLAPRFRYKRWTAEGWRSLIAWLDASGLRIVVTGGTDDDEREYSRRVMAEVPVPIVDLTGCLRFGETADLLRGAALYVGPDTVTSHVAAACGTRAVVLFGPTDPRLWGPVPSGGLARPYERVAPLQRRANVMVVQEETLPCVPCQGEGCERHRESYSECLDRMSAHKVIEATRTLLEA